MNLQLPRHTITIDDDDDDDDDGHVDDGHVDVDDHVDGHDGKHLVLLPRRQVSVTSQCVRQVAAAKKKCR